MHFNSWTRKIGFPPEAENTEFADVRFRTTAPRHAPTPTVLPAD